MTANVIKIPLKVLDVGGGSKNRAKYEFYPEADITTIDLQSGWDVMTKGLPDGPWDIILANHFIEHISNPDYFLDECKRVMNHHDTILEIATPNLAAWYNRILFLAGYVPNHVELSNRFNVGKPFKWGDVPLGGHKYVYTIPALCELLMKHGFTSIQWTGECSTYTCNFIIRTIDKILTKLNPNLASAIRIKCRYLHL